MATYQLRGGLCVPKKSVFPFVLYLALDVLGIIQIESGAEGGLSVSMETRGWELYPVSLPHIVFPLRKALGSSFNFRGETSFPHYQPKEETWKFNLSLTPEGSQMVAQDGEKGHLWRDLEEALRALVHTLTAIHTTLKRWRTVYCHITASLFLC